METGPLVISEEYLEQAHKRERRSFRVAVFWGLAVALLVGGIIFSLWRDFAQDDDIGDIQLQASACRVAPDGIECRIGHANSVLLTTPEEACFILAQGGYECRKPLDKAEQKAEQLRESVEQAQSGESDPVAVAPSRPEPSPPNPSSPAQPAPKPPAPAAPAPVPERPGYLIDKGQVALLFAIAR